MQFKKGNENIAEYSELKRNGQIMSMIARTATLSGLLFLGAYVHHVKIYQLRILSKLSIE
jgi:hypothetical protein